jgi:hypothetical protein
MSKIIRTINLAGGDEINVYRDADGYHAEYWSQEDQCIARQSGDHKTIQAALDAIEPWSDIVVA